MLRSVVKMAKRSFFGLALLTAGGIQAHGDEPRTTKVVPRAAKAAVMSDLGKGKVEGPTKAVVASSALNGNPAVETNPKVDPGKVKWHTSFQAACEASKKTGRPVLLFQMLGNLDQELC